MLILTEEVCFHNLLANCVSIKFFLLIFYTEYLYYFLAYYLHNLVDYLRHVK